MGTIDRTSHAIGETFMSCQEDTMPISKSVQRFRKIWAKMADDDATNTSAHMTKKHFFNRFVHYLKVPLCIKERTSYVDRVLEVVCKFAASFIKDEHKEAQEISTRNNDSVMDEEMPLFMQLLLNWLLDHHEVEGTQARFRICLLINHLLKSMGDDASIDDYLYQKIYDNMQSRLQDKVAFIRCQAVQALQRLQDPNDPECPILKAFLFHMSCDPSPSVRATVVKVIGASKITFRQVFQRIRDVDENVRKEAFKFIATKIHVKSLTITQREQVLEYGLSDRSPSVLALVEKDLIPAWLRFCNDKIVELLYALDVGNSNGKVASDALKLFLKGMPFKEVCSNVKFIDASKLVPLDKLTAETALLWRIVASHLNETGGDAQDFLDNLLPELTTFCKYVRHFVIEVDRSDEDDAANLNWVFIAKQLIEMLVVFDFADEVGRNNLAQLCKDILGHKQCQSVFIEPLMKIFTQIKTDTESRIIEIAEVISELRDPLRAEDEGKQDESHNMDVETINPGHQSKEVLEKKAREKKMALAKLTVELNILRNDMEEAAANRDFLKAQELKNKLDELDVEQKTLQDELTEASAMALRPQNSAEGNADAVPSTSEEDEEDTDSDPQVIRNCLEIVFQLLQDPAIKSLNPTLLTILDEVVLPNIKNLNAQIREAAVRVIGICCIRNIDLAKRHILLLIQIGQLDEQEVRMRALDMVTDLLLWHGLQAFANPESAGSRDTDQISNVENMLESEIGGIARGENYNLTQNDLEAQGGDTIVAFLSRLLDDQDVEVRTKAAEGLCKLLMVGAIKSSKLIKRLVLMWYNPMADTELKLRHMLGTFFPLYASLSRANQDAFEEAFMPTLKTLFEAPLTSPLIEVDTEDVGNFFIQLTDKNFLQNPIDQIEPTCHDNIAFAICNEIISKPNNSCAKVLIRLLQNLSVTQNDFERIKELKQLHSEIMEIIQDKLSLKILEKIGMRLEEALNSLRKTLKEEEEKEMIANPKESENQMSVHNETSFNSTKGGTKRRNLFSITNNTLFPSPDPSTPKSANASSSSQSVIISPTPDKMLAKQTEKSEVTCIKDSSDEEESEEIVSGNLRNMPKIRIVPETSDEEVVTSTQTSSTDRQTEIMAPLDTSSSSEKIDGADENIFSDRKTKKNARSGQIKNTKYGGAALIDSFFERAPGKSTRKLRKKGSSSEEENVVETASEKKRSKVPSKRDAQSSKKPTPAADSNEEVVTPRKTKGRSRASTSSSSQEIPSQRKSSRSSASRAVQEDSAKKATTLTTPATRSSSRKKVQSSTESPMTSNDDRIPSTSDTKKVSRPARARILKSDSDVSSTAGSSSPSTRSSTRSTKGKKGRN